MSYDLTKEGFKRRIVEEMFEMANPKYCLLTYHDAVDELMCVVDALPEADWKKYLREKYLERKDDEN